MEHARMSQCLRRLVLIIVVRRKDRRFAASRIDDALRSARIARIAYTWGSRNMVSSEAKNGFKLAGMGKDGSGETRPPDQGWCPEFFALWVS
jgi:hypothetical protein